MQSGFRDQLSQVCIIISGNMFADLVCDRSFFSAAYVWYDNDQCQVWSYKLIGPTMYSTTW